MAGYSAEAPPKNTARAIGRELRISVKHSIEIAREVRGMMVEDALEYLERVIEKKQPVAFKRHNRYIAHKKGKGFGPGRYPVNAARAFIRILEDAQNNAIYKGLNSEEMVIRHIAAQRGRVYKGWRPRARGRSSPKNRVTANIEVILEEIEEF